MFHMYGALLVLLAISGLMMIPKKRLLGRAGLLIFIGFAAPFIYTVINLLLQ